MNVMDAWQDLDDVYTQEMKERTKELVSCSYFFKCVDWIVFLLVSCIIAFID